MKKNHFNVWAFILSVIIGSIVVIGFTWIAAMYSDGFLFQILAMMCGFVLTGVIIGLISKGYTIIEPGLGAIFIAFITYVVLSMLQGQSLTDSFISMNDPDWLLILLNSIILTFLGSWLGEMLQHGEVKSEETTTPNLIWSWVLAGALMGVTLTILFAIIIVLIIGLQPAIFYVPFIVATLLAGYLNGRKSPGRTVREATISGYLIAVILFDTVRLSLYVEYEIPMELIIGGLAVGLILSYIGGVLGEKAQTKSENKKIELESIQQQL
jgi:hypothetical protein